MTEEIRELTEEERQQVIFQEFLEKTKERFDKYFDKLGYVCFVFNKKEHKGHSVYISNSPEDIVPVLQPYANVENFSEEKHKKMSLLKARRKLL